MEWTARAKANLSRFEKTDLTTRHDDNTREARPITRVVGVS